MKTLLAMFVTAGLGAAAVVQVHVTMFPNNPLVLLLLVFAAAALTAVFALRVENRQRTAQAAPERGANARRSRRRRRDGKAQAPTPPSDPKAKRERGTVKWFDPNKGYGFVVRADGSEIFVHFRSIRREGDERPSLADGQAVTFVAAERSRGWQAEDVIPQ